MTSTTKRKADNDHATNDDKRAKTKKPWRGQIKNSHGAVRAAAIQIGDVGIFATCQRGKERKCIVELQDLFTEYATLIHGDSLPTESKSEPESIEQEIAAEVADIKTPSAVQLFSPIRLDIECVVFFKTVAPIEPISFVQRIVEDAANGKNQIRTRYTQKLTPMSMMGHASSDGLAKVADHVLQPFKDVSKPLKYAIRTNARNHNVLQRTAIIEQIASAIGPSHPVDLQNFDRLILVEVYKNILGMSILTKAYDNLKRFNLAEIAQINQDPLPQD